jgi:hypothetical protein
MTGPLCLAAAVLLLAAPARADERDQEPLVWVGDRAVTRADLALFLQLSAASAAGEVPADTAHARYEMPPPLEQREALEQLVHTRLLLAKAREKYVTSEQVEAVLERAAGAELRHFELRVGSPLKARLLLRDLGLTVEQYKKLRVIEPMLIAQLLEDEVYAQVEVAPAEVRAHYDQNRESMRRPASVRYRQVLLLALSPDELRAAHTRACSILEAVRTGADFAEMADRHSADRASYPGGLHEVLVPDDQPDWRPAAVQGLEPGSAAEVRRVAGGVAVVSLEAVQPARMLTFEEAQPLIREELLQVRRAAARAAYVELLRSETVVRYEPAGAEIRG